MSTVNMESSMGPQLLLQAEKILLHPIHPHLISYCPTMDLIAIVTDEENLDVYRINGQRAFGLKRKSSDVTVDLVCWEFNGQAIAVAWSDGCTDIVSAETGKVIHPNLPAPKIGNGDDDVRIRCMGWGRNFIDADAVKRRTGVRKKLDKSDGQVMSIDFTNETTDHWDTFKDETSLEGFLQRQPDLQALDMAPELPDQLAMMDVETLLPKLPAIPLPPATPFMRMGQQTDSGAFSTQVQVDSLLHSHHMKDHNSVDMFIRCTDQGSVHPSIYDSLETVNIQLPSSWPIESSRPLLHASHPYSCSHGLLTALKVAGKTNLAFVPLTLGFIPSAGIYLHLISSKTSQLQNLLLYVQQCLQRIRTFWKHSRDLPSKFMMNISETLEEKGQGDLVANLYHLACTGNCPSVLKEWLVDELAEAGHKRWDHTVTGSLTTVLQLLHENLLPAIDRCAIILSRLRGLAKYHDESSGWIFNTPVTTFTSLLSLLKNLRLLAHTTLLYASDEKRHFASFSKWLRYEIDFEATEPDSQSRAEMEGRDPGVDVSVVLDYIRYGLMKSDLTPYLRPESDLSTQQRNKEATSYEDTLKAIDLLKDEALYKEQALCLDHVLGHFTSGCTTLFQQISAWQQANTSMDSALILTPDFDAEGSAALDMRMVFSTRSFSSSSSSSKEKSASVLRRLSKNLKKLTLSKPAQPNAMTTYILFAPPPPPSESTTALAESRLCIYRLTHNSQISNLATSLKSYETAVLQFPEGSRVIDAKFADDKALLVILEVPSLGASGGEEKEGEKEGERSCILISLPYHSSSSSSSGSASTASSTPSSTKSPILYTPQPTTPSLLPPTPPSSAATPNTTKSSTQPSPPVPTTLTPTMLQKHTRHTFTTRFTPLKMMVNGRKGRRVVLVLGSDCKHYRVMDLDFREKGKGRKTREGGDDDDDDDAVPAGKGGEKRGRQKEGSGKGEAESGSGSGSEQWSSDEDWEGVSGMDGDGDVDMLG